MNAYTNKEGTVYYSAILKEHIARAVDLLTDIVFHSVYPQAEIDIMCCRPSMPPCTPRR